MRAVYGGFGIAVAAVLLYAALRPDIRSVVALTVAFALAGRLIGRVISAVIGERNGLYPNWFYALAELVLAGVLVAALVAD